jgi:hypothetical protein
MADLANPCRGQALPASPKIDADVGLAQTELRRQKSGGPLPTTCNGSANSTEAVVSTVGNEPTERRFKGATLWRRTFFYRLSRLAWLANR